MKSVAVDLTRPKHVVVLYCAAERPLAPTLPSGQRPFNGKFSQMS